MSLSNRFNNRSGFTLVELLVVITIIGILVSLLVPTLAAALKTSREAAIALDIKQLQLAIESFKKERKTNAYPPDFSKDHPQNTIEHRADALSRFVRTNFRNTSRNYVFFDSGNGAWGGTWGTSASNPDEIDPAEALHFWLALSQKNPQAPLPLNGGAEGWKFFDFKTERLVDEDNDGWFEYLPPHGEPVPYVYFENSRYLDPTSSNPQPPPGYDTDRYVATGHGYPNAGSVKPYYRQVPDPPNNVAGTYQAPSKFQIICAGYDGNFGSHQDDKAYPSGNGFEEPDLDNISGFADGRLDNKLD